MTKQPSILKEIRTHGTDSFPCAIYRTHSAGKGTLVKHHWHDEVEILYFSAGKFRLEINMESFPIRSECFYFINPGELHSIITETSDRHWEDAIVFSPGLLCFDSCDEAQIRLLKPIRSGRLLFPRCLTPEQPAFAPMKSAFTDVMHAFGQMKAVDPSVILPAADTSRPEDACVDSTAVTDDLTSQLYIKSALLYILATLSANRLFMPAESNQDKRVESIKTALTYMKHHYQEKLHIADLAGCVNLNEQYFCRLFKKAVGHSPMEYLNEYRIKQAIRLLEETGLPVTEVCLECGFNNMGNFLREFRRYTGTTPLQYRKSAAAVTD